MSKVNVSLDSKANLWGGCSAGEAGYIDSSICSLAAKARSVVFNEDGADFFLLSDAAVGVVSVLWEPTAPTKDRCAIVTRADVDRSRLLQFMREVFGHDVSIVVYPDEYEIE
ncbi:hypothetical protein [Roseovarius sp. 2305UL8-3]|uniref:hypothetical protein n=1 Tax=Roseovarius conchicola TaxID=3121636 RepID=UPI003528D329